MRQTESAQGQHGIFRAGRTVTQSASAGSRSNRPMNDAPLEFASPRLTQWDPEHTGDQAAREKLRPALFAQYGDLANLRYDYPLVLVDSDDEQSFVQSLSSIFDGILQKIAPPGASGEQLRRDMLRLETGIRMRALGGVEGLLSVLWRLTETDLITACEDAEKDRLEHDLDRARDLLGSDGPLDGHVIDCTEATPVRLLVHGWEQVQAAKAKAFRKKVEGLILSLSDILKADFMKSDKASRPEALQVAIGDASATDFDFDAMSAVLAKGPHENLLSEDRRRRIGATLMVLNSQRFFAPGRASADSSERDAPFDFVFDNCAEALDAFRDRLPQMVDLIKAITIAELEIVNRYRVSQHEAFFAHFDESELGEDELALFPSYLVCLRDGHSGASETVQAFEAIASGLPVKVLIQTDDILGDPTPEPPRASFGGGSTRLAAMAVGVNDAFVLQAASSDLYRLRDTVRDGLAYDGPALFSIFSGATPTISGVPSYLVAAAAKESRAFPTFTYNPAAGPDRVSRFRIGDNPQSDRDWPEHTLSFEDQDQQRVVEQVAFTHADFAICDARYAKHRIPVASSQWHDSIVPVDEHVQLSAEQRGEKAAYVWTIDADNALRKTVVDDKLLRGARRCLKVWQGLQEIGGINDPYVSRILAEERATWEREKETELEALREELDREAPQAGLAKPAIAEPVAPAASDEAPPTVEAAPASDAEQVAPADPDAAYIETPRCTTCNECTQINNKMFIYNEDMQAEIADPDAGSFRQLVEAAEICQVSIIHPGKPRNPDEPGLDELMERAAPFN